MSIATVGVVGAGLMGSGIAQVCAAASIKVVIHDINDAAIQKGIASIDSSLSRLVAKEKLTEVGKASILGRISGSVDTAALKDVDFLIEAASEDFKIKSEIIRGLEAVVSSNCIIASNTSSISITRLARSLKNPRRFVGMHFFNPVPLMSLVEVIRGFQTDEVSFEATRGLAQSLGKVAIAVNNAPGFVVNRILCPMINEAIFVLQEGLASKEEIDEGMKLGANHPIGPLALADLVGLDTFLSVMNVFHEEFNEPKYRPARLLKEMVDAGHLGRKTGQGFYRYAS
ncbi:MULTISPECIES: 3-hydroxybutyryl-CoA dehydrogenase [Paraburkholderia]|jgi:3-hydroxybutyryl-CoA dehydrogenase|uniref:3-hydroxybutyryl-CoA dehydrogenase n=1 Tax=Paraburkholderia TaxID=1822464 RepID=UPI0038BE1158